MPGLKLTYPFLRGLTAHSGLTMALLGAPQPPACWIPQHHSSGHLLSAPEPVPQAPGPAAGMT